MSREEFNAMVKAMYYEEAIGIVQEDEYKPIEPIPKSPKPIDCLNTWGIDMLAFGLVKGIEIGINMMEEKEIVA